jgi:hypothetical protein
VKRNLWILFATLLAPACASTPPEPGSDCAHAIVIQATREKQGIAQEHHWIADHYPGAQTVSQGLMMCEGFPADSVTIKTHDGKTVSLVFNIGAFYGKF